MSDLRLFVAVYPPAQAAQSLLAQAAVHLPSRGEADAAGAPRFTPPEQVHLTLQFIGPARSKDLDAIIESVARAAAGLGPFELRPTALVALPESGRPRLIAAETDRPPTVLELHRRLVQRLARTPAQRRAAERFVPHLTLVRFAHAGPATRIAVPIEAEAFLVERIALMHSALSPTGAVHRLVHDVQL